MNHHAHPVFTPILNILTAQTRSMNFPLTVAYNMEDKKIGCPLWQAALGATFSGDDVSLFFETHLWELSPDKLQLFEIRNQQEFDIMVKITTDDTGIYRRTGGSRFI